MHEDVNRPALDAEGGRHPHKRFGGLSRRAAVAMTAGGLVIGGIAGGFIVTSAATSSSSSTSAGTGSGAGSAAATPAPSASPKAFTPNENATHESGESAQREADENSGKFAGGPGGGGKPNEDPTHESGESSSRESAENSGAAPSPSPTP